MNLPVPARPAAAWRRWAARQRARYLTEHWRLGLIDAPLVSLLDRGTAPPPVRWLTGPEPGGYWADPFALADDSATLYAERFDERSGRGHIERLRLDGDRVVSLGPVQVEGAGASTASLGGDRHASFPNVFELDGRRLAVAETAAARRCDLYEVDVDGRWHSPRPLVEGRRLADPAVFRWQSRYWLAATDEDIGTHANLCLFHAEGLDGPWTPHAGNPVRVDAGGARMAGRFFEHDGVLYRPGQDCRATYGAAVVLHRVDHCSTAAFRETAVRRIEPDPHGPAPHGLHTLTAWGDRTLVDGKRYVLNPSKLRRKLRTFLSARGTG